MALENEFFKILDITNYLPPCSYDKYLKSYNAQGAKSVFPFKWLDSIGKLSDKQLPPIELFYSDLKSCNMLGNTLNQQKDIHR